MWLVNIQPSEGDAGTFSHDVYPPRPSLDDREQIVTWRFSVEYITCGYRSYAVVGRHGRTPRRDGLRGRSGWKLSQARKCR